MTDDNLLFGDLFDGELRECVERVDVPADDSLEKILSDVRHSNTCGACKKGMPVIFGEGFAGVNVMVIGEGPGVDDIGSGRPFMGQAGVLLDRMLAAIELRRAECYVCNVIKCIPPGERNFSVEEIEDCRPFLLRQILAVDPRVIIAFGALAAQMILTTRIGLIRNFDDGC